MDKGIPISARVVPNRGSIDWRKVAARLLSRAEAAEARLEELTRERDAAITRCGEWAADFARKCVRLEEAKAALEPFAHTADWHEKIHGADCDDGLEVLTRMLHLRAARAFLHQGGSE